MSHSPLAPQRGAGLGDYFKHWNDLSNLIRQGRSFSGRERNCVFLNTGQDRWADISGVSGLDYDDDGRAIAVTDWDQDGDLDLWIANRTGPRVRFMRNDCPSDKSYLRLRIVGSGRNLDAIGSRVEVYLDDEGPCLIKTLRAGGGFVSQSSKWLHFGLGTPGRIARVVVRWPDGSHATFRDLKANCSYRIEAGVPLERIEPHAPVALVDPGGRVESMPERVLLTRRLPVAELDYVDATGKKASLRDYMLGPTFVTLWASWCPTCAEELRNLESHRDTWKDMKILALCADDLVEGNPTNQSAQEIVSQRAESEAIDWGTALPDTVRILNQLRSQVLYRQRPLSLPAGFLFDASGRLAAIYSAAVDPTQFASDLRVIQQDRTTMAQAFPFAGRNGLSLLPFSPPEMAAAYIEGGYYQDAEQELIRYLVETRRKLNQSRVAPTKELARKVEKSYVVLGSLLRKQGRNAEARAVFQQGLELLPNSAKLKTAVASF